VGLDELATDIPQCATTCTTIHHFHPCSTVHHYPPAVWGEEEEVDNDDEWDVGSYEDEDLSLAEDTALTECEHHGDTSSSLLK
jgi:hypothetical protein